MTNAAGNNKILWALIAMVALLAMVSITNLYLMLNSDKNDEEAAADVELAEAPAPIFVKIGPLTVNLESEAYGQRLLYTTLSLRVRDEDTREFLLTHMPEVHSRMLLLLSAQQAEELATSAGKQALAQKVLALFEQPFTEPQPPLNIDAVLFSDFILQ